MPPNPSPLQPRHAVAGASTLDRGSRFPPQGDGRRLESRRPWTYDYPDHHSGPGPPGPGTSHGQTFPTVYPQCGTSPARSGHRRAPYLALKIAWASGSHIGIPDGSTLLEHHKATIAGSVESALLDSMVVVLVLLLTQQWGRRVPAWLLILPVWAATGLLSPIVVGYPLQLGARLLGGTAAPSGEPAARPFLHEWVFTVVYTGFIVQALALGALFVLYARSRWGHLWRGQISGLAGQGPARVAQRATALMASAVVLVPLTAHLLWATGSTRGLTDPMVAERTSDFHALEAAYVLFAVMTVTGLLLVAFPRAGGALPLRLALSLAFVGSAALACWGGYLMLTALANRDPSRRITELMNVTYSMQLLAGMLVFTMGAYFFAERAAQ